MSLKTFTRAEQLYVLSHDRSWGRGWDPVKPVLAPPHKYFCAGRSGAVLLLWFLTVTCSCCPYLYFGLAIMLVTYFVNFRKLNDHLFGKELFIRFSASAFRKLPSIYVFSYFPFGFEGRIWDLIVPVPDRCLSFYFTISSFLIKFCWIGFVSNLTVPRLKILKSYIFFSFKNVEKFTHQQPASCLTTTHILMSLWRHAMEDDINI